jgi:hydroxymethylglutaryl-CoA lyase
MGKNQMTIMPTSVKIVECPRDAMQGWPDFIPTTDKIEYLNALLKVGFDTLDFGSFVSPQAIPQMRDTAEVLSGLQLDQTSTSLLAIVANLRGAQDASSFDQIRYLGYPFSVSETFQQRNTNSSMQESLHRVEEIVSLCSTTGKEPVIYISMGFGNPYGDAWSPDIVIHWVKRLAEMGVKIIALADTVGVSTRESITHLFSSLIPEVKGVEFGAHLHSHPDSWLEKVEAAYNSGCRRFDSAFKGIGGCPMADDRLVGNLATEQLIAHFGGSSALGFSSAAITNAMGLAGRIFHA